MDCRTGRVYSGEELESAIDRFKEAYPDVDVRRNFRPIPDSESKRAVEVMGRSDRKLKGHEKCLCGSGRQFKNCCKIK